MLDKVYFICCDVMGDLSSRTQKQEFVFKRWVFYKVARELCQKSSFRQIGLKTNRDHATVIHGLKKIDWEIQNDDHIKKMYELCYDRCIIALSEVDRVNIQLMTKSQLYLHQNINLKSRLIQLEAVLQRIPQYIKTRYA